MAREGLVAPHRAPSEDLADIVEMGILRVDTELRILSWNTWLEAATGWPALDVIGRTIDAVFPTMHQGARDAFARAVAGSTVVMSHRLHGWLLPMPPPTGYEACEQMQQMARLVPTFAADGVATGALALITDVTERAAREAELDAAAKVAQAANQGKSEFLAAMTHEMRTPIGAIWNYAEILLRGGLGELPPPQREPLTRIKALGDHMARIVDEILTFARVEAGHVEMMRTVVDAVQLARDAVAAVESLAARKHLPVVMDLPQAAVLVSTDAVKVRQILINLLGNAVKFTQKGQVGLRLVRRTGGAVSFYVRDTGRGMPAGDLARIFEPFTQVSEDSARDERGTGLGLAISLRLAQRLGGNLTVASEMGVGSTFELTLPAGVDGGAEPAG